MVPNLPFGLLFWRSRNTRIDIKFLREFLAVCKSIGFCSVSAFVHPGGLKTKHPGRLETGSLFSYNILEIDSAWVAWLYLHSPNSSFFPSLPCSLLLSLLRPCLQSSALPTLLPAVLEWASCAQSFGRLWMHCTWDCPQNTLQSFSWFKMRSHRQLCLPHN